MMGRWMLMLGAAALVSACRTQADGREWRDNTGKHRIEAELVEVEEGQVVLRRPDGRLVKLPLARLSQSDQDFVRQQAQNALDLPQRPVRLGSGPQAPVRIDPVALERYVHEGARREPPAGGDGHGVPSPLGGLEGEA